MFRREFIAGLSAAFFVATHSSDKAARLAKAAQAQVGVTLTYDPAYTHLTYPSGDVPRSTGVCADVIVRAARDGLSLDLQKLVHEDMLRAFDTYPPRRLWGQQHTDSSIDHRRVPNLETYWQRANAALWTASTATAGDAFPQPLLVGDILTWRLGARLPHVGIVVARNNAQTSIVHNIGGGAQLADLTDLHPHRANGHFRWPTA